MTTSKTLVRAVPLGKDSGKSFSVPLHEIIPTDVVELLFRDDPKSKLARDILLVGTSRIFVDCQASAKTDAERLGACNKKLDAWRAGEMNVRGGFGGGETEEGEIKRLLLAAYMERTGVTQAKAEMVLKGRGLEILASIARNKARATVEVPAILEPFEVPGAPTEQELRKMGAKEADRTAILEASAAYIKAVDDATAPIFKAAETDWRAKAKASLEAKAKAREQAGKMDLTDLL